MLFRSLLLTVVRKTHGRNDANRKISTLYISVSYTHLRPKEALTYLNVVRERAGIPDVTEEMLNDMPAMDWKVQVKLDVLVRCV